MDFIREILAHCWVIKKWLKSIENKLDKKMNKYVASTYIHTITRFPGISVSVKNFNVNVNLSIKQTRFSAIANFAK